MSDEIKFECAKCGQHIAAPESMKGELVDCPNCGEVNEVQPPRTWDLVPVEAVVEPPPPKPPPSLPAAHPVTVMPDVILAPQKSSHILVSAGFTTALIAGLVASVPFLGWIVAVPLGIAAVIMAALLIARDRISAGVLLLVFSFVGIPFIGFVGTALLMGGLEAVAKVDQIKAASDWRLNVSTNQLDDVVSTSAALTATSFTGPGYGSDPVLF
jgi:hypothetical protein